MMTDTSLSLGSRVACSVMRHMAWQDGREDENDRAQLPPIEQIAAAVGCSANTLRGYLAELTEAGWVTVERSSRRASMTYWIWDSPHAPSGLYVPAASSSESERGVAQNLRDSGPVPFVGPEPSKTLETANAVSPAISDERRVYNHWRQQRGRVAARYDRPTPRRIEKIRARLKEFTDEELMRAIDGVAYDPWPDRRLHDDVPVIFRSREQVEKFLDLYEAGPGVNGRVLTPEQIATRYDEVPL